MTKSECDSIAQIERTKTALAEVLAVYESLTAYDHSEQHIDQTDEDPEGCVRCRMRAEQIARWREPLRAPQGAEVIAKAEGR